MQNVMYEITALISREICNKISNFVLVQGMKKLQYFDCDGNVADLYVPLFV